MKTVNKFDLCIVGAGVVGASLAAYCKKFPNLSIALIDVNFDYQDRIVGELLQPSGVEILNELGLSRTMNAIEAQPVRGYALFNGERHFSIPYAPNEAGEEQIGRGITNGKFLQELRAEAKQNPQVVTITGKVQSLVYEKEKVVGVSYQDIEGSAKQVLAENVIASDGFFSKLRKGVHLIPPKVTSYFIGLELDSAEMPYDSYGHIITSEVANILCYKISNNKTRVLIDYPSETMPAKNESFKQFIFEDIYAVLPKGIQKAYKEQVTMSALKFMPNHYLPAKLKQRPKGLILLGDALNMRHPLTGGGMTVGLKDVYFFAECLASHSTPKFEEKVNDFYNKRSEYSATVNILADALYKVVNNDKLREACFMYLGSGEANYTEPISILAGTNTNKIDLLKHFVAVALNGSLQQMEEENIKNRILHSKDILTNATKIIYPLLKNEFQWL